MVQEYLNNKTFEILISVFQNIKKEKNQLYFISNEITCTFNENKNYVTLPAFVQKLSEK